MQKSVKNWGQKILLKIHVNYEVYWCNDHLFLLCSKIGHCVIFEPLVYLLTHSLTSPQSELLNYFLFMTLFGLQFYNTCLYSYKLRLFRIECLAGTTFSFLLSVLRGRCSVPIEVIPSSVGG